jgi:sulfane dehydrogenase subunit SoxC
MGDIVNQPGRLRPAPENFLSEDQLKAVAAGRRDFLRKSLLAAGAAWRRWRPGPRGDPNILENAALDDLAGPAVATNPYGMPSKYESQLVRRESPGLARVGGASVSFCAAAGPVRHHHAVRPAFRAPSPGLARHRSVRHRLMINGSDDSLIKKPKVYTMDELMRLPSVSRIHFIECGANTGLEWGNVAVPTVQYTTACCPARNSPACR